ncbi:MAG: hypothetical protein NTV88_01455 [Candidatus Micrarchaeota archaeon]|nr:hypothetical protein [Candidatus Micrarchaeota archaeon]
MANGRPNGNFFGESVLMSRKVEQEYVKSYEKRENEKKPMVSPSELTIFYEKYALRSHESTMLFTISSDLASLRDFARDKDKFFSDNFRKACKQVLHKVHNMAMSGKPLKPQLAIR